MGSVNNPKEVIGYRTAQKKNTNIMCQNLKQGESVTH